MRQTLSFTRVLLDAIPRGRWRLIAAILLAFAASAASVALMGVAAFLLSWAALFPPVLYLQAPAVGVRFFGISRGVLRYVERLVGHDLALRMQGALRLRVYDKLSGTTLSDAAAVTCSPASWPMWMPSKTWWCGSSSRSHPPPW